MEDKTTTRKTLKEHIKHWQALIDALPFPVSVHDADFNVTIANKHFTAICGRSDVIGLKCYQLIHCKEKPVENCPMEKMLKTLVPSESDIYEPLLKKHLSVHVSPIIVDNILLGATHSIIDLTEIKKSEISYKALSAELGASLEESQKREQSLRTGKEAFLNMLEDIGESYRELENLFIGIVRVIVNALDAKSHWTRGHSERVTQYAELIAHEMNLDDDDIKNLRLAALLHDVGKIGTYDYLLDKPSELTDREREIVEEHPAQGATILKEIKQLNVIIPLIRHHHERIDGKGYPDGLEDKKIPIGARILHVADSFDSMTADRPYRPSPGEKYAISELERCSGTQFDQEVVKAFLTALDKSKQNEQPSQ
jgi:putative nucleotidyltransferase with HDIG domain/PAS domain S-box-containing protein